VLTPSSLEAFSSTYPSFYPDLSTFPPLISSLPALPSAFLPQFSTLVATLLSYFFRHSSTFDNKLSLSRHTLHRAKRSLKISTHAYKRYQL